MSLVHEEFTRSVQAGEVEESVYKSSIDKMDAFVKKHFAGVKATGLVKRGDPADEILIRAKEGGADLIIMGTHGRKGFDLLLFGSVAEKVVRLSSVPVLTVRPKQ
jgi:nucleotide-binding universal stress UspA family protein